MFTGNNRFFGSVHTANRGTIIPAATLVPGTDTLNPGYFHRVLAIGRAYHLSLKRAGSGKDTLKFRTGNDVRHSRVAVFAFNGRIKGLKAGGKDNRPHGKFNRFFLHRVVNRLGLADRYTLEAFAAKTAVQAPLCFRTGNFFSESGIYLIKTGQPFLQRNSSRMLSHLPVVFSFGQCCRLFLLLSTPFFKVNTVKITVYRDSRFMSVLDGFHGRFRSGDTVTSGKDTILSSRQCHRVNNEPAPASGLDICLLG